MSSPGEVWIYHEQQDALLCGQHALNNLVQACVFSAEGLAEIAHQLDQMELNYMAQNDEGGIRSRDYLKRVAEGSGNVDPSGNFSIEVLRSALMNQYNLELPNIRQEGMGKKEVTDMEGFICHRDSHWFAIRKIHERFWNLNSTKERPEQISHFRLAAEIESLQVSGYSVFCVVSGLPSPCTSAAGRDRGLPQYWWKEEDLVHEKGSDAVTAATDPWRSVGTGMRLDGRPVKNATESSNGVPNSVIGGLTEHEMMQFAMEASLQQDTKPAPTDENARVQPKPEPAATDSGALRIQLRLPDGSRKIRRFFGDESVEVLYAFVEDCCSGQGRQLELRYGFPPKDLAPQRNMTIEEAKLAGESVQGRYV